MWQMFRLHVLLAIPGPELRRFEPRGCTERTFYGEPADARLSKTNESGDGVAV